MEFGFMDGADVPCEVCEGRRFSEDVLRYELGGKNIADVLETPAAEAAAYFAENKVAVGLGYITLGQPLNTLSGGERQRLKLAVHMADKKAQADVLVLDEPSTGLHLADVDKLLELLDHLAEEGNTVVCVEHHLAVVAHADHIIDLGPGAGSAGGGLVAACSPRELAGNASSVTGRYLAEYVA